MIKDKNELNVYGDLLNFLEDLPLDHEYTDAQIDLFCKFKSAYWELNYNDTSESMDSKDQVRNLFDFYIEKILKENSI